MKFPCLSLTPHLRDERRVLSFVCAMDACGLLVARASCGVPFLREWLARHWPYPLGPF